MLAITGAGLFWACRSWIARIFLSDESLADDVGWLSIGVALTVLASAQVALLTGLRRVGDLAQINIAAGIVGGLVSVLALYLWPAQGVVVLAVVAPAFSFIFGRLLIIRLGKPAGSRPPLSELIGEWVAMIRPGFAFMLSGLIAIVGQLIVRTLVQAELGPDALGQFQAAWAISVTYLGFVLGAMTTDYLPRLTAVVENRTAAVKLINEQTEVALLLCAPFVVGMLAFAPWLIHLLYSAEFGPAVEILRWQLLGDIFKVIVWPIGFVQQAKGAGRSFLLTEMFGAVLLCLGVFIGLPHIGIAATGVAFLFVYIAYLPLMWWLGRIWVGFSWTRPVALQAVGILLCAVIVDVACRRSDALGAIIGGLLAVTLAAWALIRLSSLSGIGGRLGRIAAVARKIIRLCVRFR